MKNLDDEIEKAYTEVKKREKLLHKMETMSTDILQQELMLEELKAIKLKEKADIDELEKTSFRDIFASILGNKEEQLEIERQEFLWAQLNYLACKRRIRDAKNEKAEVEKEISKYNISEQYLKDLLLRKERRINKSVKEFKEYLALENRVRSRKQMIVEIQEAHEIGNSLITLIADLQVELTKVNYEGWSVDPLSLSEFSGKGRHSSYAKKKYIENCRELVLNIDQKIRSFINELDDIHSNFELDFTRHLTIVKNFLEIFFDNLITDWVIRAKISSARKSTDNLFSRIERIMMMLDHEKKTTLNEIDFYEKKKREYLLDG